MTFIFFIHTPHYQQKENKQRGSVRRGRGGEGRAMAKFSSIMFLIITSFLRHFEGKLPSYFRLTHS